MPCFLFLVANLLMPLSLLIFATGFFPYKTFLAGTATFNGIEGDHAKVAPFDKVILMVVDALRRYVNDVSCFLSTTIADSHSDFVYSPNSGFTFTQKYSSLESRTILQMLSSSQ